MKRWRCPTRPLILIALLLLAGAVVNVAVAWGITAKGAMRATSVEQRTQPWRVLVPDDWPQTAETRVTAFRLGARSTAQHAFTFRRDESVIYTAERYEAGWPLQCVYCVQLERSREAILAGGTTIPATTPVRAPAWMEGIPIGGRLDRTWFAESHHRLPVAAIWPHWLVNTLFYTTILAVPLSFFPIRRRLRARRGRCPKCGYDLAGLGGADRGGEPAPPCPECGAIQ